MGKAYFQFKQFLVRQDHSPMRVNTDSCLLGAVAKPPKEGHFLDIGAGTGVLALMMAQKAAKATITALEPNPLALQDLKPNLASSRWAKHFRLVEKRLQDFEPEQPFDFMLANPPYFSRALPNPDQHRAKAKHQVDLKAKDLAEFTARHLNPKGEAWFVLPCAEATLLLKAMYDNGLTIKKLIRVRSFPDSKVIRHLQVFANSQSPTKVKDLHLYDSRGVYSKVAERLFRPFYL